VARLNTDSNLASERESEVDLLELVRVIWRGKWIVILFAGVFSVASVFYALSLPNKYKSFAVLAPSDSSSGGGLADIAGQLGGVAALAGFSIPSGGSDKSAEALHVLQSWSFIEEFIQEQNIAPEVFAAVGWNVDTRELVFAPEVYDPVAGVWKRNPPKHKNAEPSSWELYNVFREFLAVEDDLTSGFKTLSIEYYSPDRAQEWLALLVNKLNQRFKEAEIKEAEKNIEFLKSQIGETSLASMQQIFFGLIEDQTKSLMLAKGTEEFVFKVVSEPRVPEDKSSPKRALICIVSFIVGTMLGLVVVLIANVSRKQG